VYLCGHTFLNLGDVQLPMARSRVVTTLSSQLQSTKIVNVAGSIGTITTDHLTAVTGKLGAPPPMIPLDLVVHALHSEKKLHFELINHPKLTPLLVAITTLNGLTQNPVYGEGTTLHLTGEIRLQGHPPVEIENTFAPSDSLTPDGFPIALTMQNVFARIFSNTFEPASRCMWKVFPGENLFRSKARGWRKGRPLPAKLCVFAFFFVLIAERRRSRKPRSEFPSRFPGEPRFASWSATVTSSIALRAASPSRVPAAGPWASTNSSLS